MSDSEADCDGSSEGPGELASEAFVEAGLNKPQPNLPELEQLFSLLPTLERAVLELRSGFRDGHPRTWKEISEHLGMSLEDVCKLNARGLRRLYEPTRELWRRSS